LSALTSNACNWDCCNDTALASQAGSWSLD
jgi:hypothetical protein